MRIPSFYFRSLLIALLLLCGPLTARPGAGQELKKLRDSGRLGQPIIPQRINRDLLERVIFLLTNLEREQRNLQPLIWDDSLQRSARVYAADMARREALSHDSDTPGLETLSSRLLTAGIGLDNTKVGENLAVDFFRKISGIPFQIEVKHGRRSYLNAKNGRPIGYHTYLSFARETITHWMGSPGHRKNLLGPDFTRLGVGIGEGLYQEFDAVYVTQHFQGDLVKNE